ncbi:hypothetical protein IJ182_05605 [bacterium]|nr:hypothetical protein [bacterium]
MFGIQNIKNNIIPAKNDTKVPQKKLVTKAKTGFKPQNLSTISSDNFKAYIPSFTRIGAKKPVQTGEVTIAQKYDTVKSKLDKQGQQLFASLDSKGILMNQNSNDNSTVLDNLYNIATKERIPGLKDTQIINEVLKALDNPFTITQKFGDIPNEVAQDIAKETGSDFPNQAYNVVSSSCVVASMEFNLASKYPAEFVRFAEGLSSSSYSVDKKVKISDIADGTAECLWKLREFNTDSYLENNWENANIKIKPDRNAIIRARVQSSYKDKGERSCVDVLIQSALLNLGSQNTYNALTDERTGKFNPDKTGLTDMEKNFVERVVFQSPKVSVVYQEIDETGKLSGYRATPAETKQQILNSLALGQNVIIGYTHMDKEKNVNGGHEITIIGYEEDENKNGFFICNDTDDDIDTSIKISEKKLLPLIHHAGISREAFGKDDVYIEPWREIVEEFKNIRENK